jgi:hypothetical protein
LINDLFGEQENMDPYITFVYGIRSPYTKESYLRRLRGFFDGINLGKGKTFQERCNIFVHKGRADPNWAFNNIIRFLHYQKARVEKKEGAFAGKEILTTEEDASENATATFYEVVRFNFETGAGRGIAIAHVHTDPTGKLAPLDGMILAGHDELHPDGTGLLTLWEWQSGIPYVEMQGQPPMMQESSMNTQK